MNDLPSDRLRLVQAHALRGHRQGLAQPCLHALFHLEPSLSAAKAPLVSPDQEALLVPIPSGMDVSLSRGASNEQGQRVLAALAPLNALLLRMQRTAGWPVCGGAVVERVGRAQQAAEQVAVVVVFPAFDSALLFRALPWALAATGGRSLVDSRSDADSLDRVLALLSAAAPLGTNTRPLLEAAYGRGVPVQRLASSSYQYGWGAHARWMESSFTDADSVISARLARDKRAAHALLRLAGLPVPAQRAVRSADDACRAAGQMGYPVVMKPADQDGGRGVEAGLQDETALRRAHARARTHSTQLVVERHIEGQDYRLGVLNGRLAWCTWREPAGVWGDGQATVSTLIDAANRDPRRSTRPGAHMVPITLNAEARELLSEQGVALDVVPAKGTFVRLRRAANVSSGGRPVDVLANVHPDNAALAVQAARLFRLSLAGVDLITPDIGRSWREAGGAICEVNGQPQFSVTAPWVPAEVVAETLGGQGRVPVVVVLTPCRWGPWAETLLDFMARMGLEGAGFALEDGLYLGRERVADARTPFDDVQGLLLDPRLRALVVASEARQWLRTGMPVDRIDLLIADGARHPRVAAMLMAASSGGDWAADVPLAGLSSKEGTDAMPKWLARLAGFLVQRVRASTSGSSGRSDMPLQAGVA